MKAGLQVWRQAFRGIIGMMILATALWAASAVAARPQRFMPPLYRPFLVLATEVSGNITTNTTWSQANSPYVVTSSVYVANGVTLTIEAGVIVKFAPNTALYLQGNGQLHAVGTADAEIVFTSLKDDNYGGDSNGDGGVTVPVPGDWATINSNGTLSTVQLEHVRVRYGRSALEVHGHLLLRDSVLELNSNTTVYIYPNTGTAPLIAIERTTIYAGRGDGIYIYTHPGAVNLQENSIETENYYAGITLEKVASAQAISNTIQVKGTDERTRGIRLKEVGENVTLTNNRLLRSNTDKAYAAIEVQNSRPQLTGNTIQGFTAAVLINGGYPSVSPHYSNNDFSQNEYSNAIAVTGDLTTGAWDHVGGYAHLVQGTATIAAQATVTIPAGFTIKFSRYGAIGLAEQAQLVARGTITQPITFTSIKDDRFGGDSNSDGSATTPVAGDWYGLNSAGTLSTLELDYVSLHYANEAIDARGNLALRHSLIEQSSTGINIYPNTGTEPSVSVEQTVVRGTTYSIYVSRVPSNLKMTGNALQESSSYALYNADRTLPVVASGNWWGAASGPLHSTTNPSGQGGRVNDLVDFTGWLTSEPPFVPLARPKPAAGAPIALADSFESDDGCSQAKALTPNGVFQEHTFHKADDTDWVQFAATGGVTYRVEVQPTADSLADVNMDLYPQCDGAVAEAWQADFSPGVRLDFKPTQSGTIYVRLHNYDGKVYGDNTGYQVSVRPLQSQAQGGALILVAGRLKQADPLQANIYHITQGVYELFKANGYSDDNIYYLAADPTLVGRDGDATLANVQTALTSWAIDKVGANRPLTLYLMDHGNVDTFYVDGVNQQQLTPNLLNDWLTQLEAAVPNVRTNVIIEACYSGSFIEGAKRMSKAGRLVITSTNAVNVAFASTKGAQFSDRFLTSLREGYSLPNSFWDAQYSVRRLYKLQEPWIDVNGNGIPNEEADGAEVMQHNPGVDQGAADNWAPYIVTAQAPTQIVDGAGTLRAEVRDNKSVKRVWAAIYPPTYQAPSNVEELIAEDVPTADLIAQGNNQFSLEYKNFTEAGLYQVAFYAEDHDGLKARLLVLDVQHGDGKMLFLPLIFRR